MIYSYISCEIVIADLISRTRLVDTTYADDLLVWLKDGINMLRLRQMMIPTYKCLEVRSHVTKLPCGLVFIDGIVYKGQRLRLGAGSTDVRIAKGNYFRDNYQSYFATDPSDPAYQNIQDYKLVRGADLKPVTDYCTSEYYIPYPNHLQTSFEEGELTEAREDRCLLMIMGIRLYQKKKI